MLNFVGAAIPAAVAAFLTPARIALIFKAVVEAVQVIQAAMDRSKSKEEKKQEAIEFACASYDLADSVFNQSPDVDLYVKSTMIPAFIDGVILSFNLSRWFDSDQPLSTGGLPVPGVVPYMPAGAQPSVPIPAPRAPEA